MKLNSNNGQVNLRIKIKLLKGQRNHLSHYLENQGLIGLQLN